MLDYIWYNIDSQLIEVTYESDQWTRFISNVSLWRIIH